MKFIPIRLVPAMSTTAVSAAASAAPNPCPITLTLDSLQQAAWQNSEDHGFHSTPTDRDPITKLMLMVEEVVEAFEEIRDGADLTTTRYREKDGKPEGFGTELADLVIRAADFAGIMQFSLSSAVSNAQSFAAGHESLGVVDDLMGMVRCLTAARSYWLYQDEQEFRQAVGEAVDRAFRLAGVVGVDLWQRIVEKHRFNCGREWKHGRQL